MAAGGAAARPAAHGDGPVVLVVDDNRLFRWVLETILDASRPAFRSRGVATGAAAIAYLRGEAPYVGAPRPGLVVLDFHLPDMDAPEVLARVRASPSLRDIPILVLTQAHWAEDEQAAVAAGATTFCAKPSSVGELRRVIESFWARARR